MDKTVKLVLLGVGGYLVWVYVIQPMLNQQSAATGLPAGSLPAGTTATIPPQSQIPAQQPTLTAPSSNPLRTQLIALAQGYGANKSGSGDSVMLNLDEWNYWYHQAKPSSDPEADPRNPANSLLVANLNAQGVNAGGLITVDQYLNALTPSGLGRVGYVTPLPLRRNRGMNFGNKRSLGAIIDMPVVGRVN